MRTFVPRIFGVTKLIFDVSFGKIFESDMAYLVRKISIFLNDNGNDMKICTRVELGNVFSTSDKYFGEY